MRILHAIQELETGGAERVVVTLAAGARAAGHDVAVAAARGALAAEIDADLFELPRVRRRLSRVLPAARALRRAITTWRPDLVHCHNPGIAAVAALATMRGRAVPGVVSVHGVPDEDYAAAGRVLRVSGFPVVACGPGVADGLAAAGREPATTIVNGVAPAPAPVDRAALDAELGVPAHKRLVVAVGRLASVKNHALALDALARVPDAALVIAGEGPLRADLEHQIRDLGLADRAVLAGLRRDARAIVAAADAFLMSSQSEGLPLAALEALAAGTPVVATAVRGVRELLTDGENALLVPPDDPDALAGALGRVLADRDLAERLARAGRELALQYTDEAMVEQYLTLYASVLASRT